MRWRAGTKWASHHVTSVLLSSGILLKSLQRTRKFKVFNYVTATQVIGCSFPCVIFNYKLPQPNLAKQLQLQSSRTTLCSARKKAAGRVPFLSSHHISRQHNSFLVKVLLFIPHVFITHWNKSQRFLQMAALWHCSFKITQKDMAFAFVWQHYSPLNTHCCLLLTLEK